LNSSLESSGTRVIHILFLKFLEDKSRRFKINFDLQPDFLIQPKAHGLLHMECEFNRTPYKRRLENYSAHEQLTASIHDTAKKVLRRHLHDEVRKNLKTPSEVLKSLQY
jgi:hypothetical protein